MSHNDNDFSRHQAIWETNARQNAKWAVISDPKKVRSEWNDQEFFASGEADVQLTFENLNRLNINIQTFDAALDFGCGVGRLTRALANRFRSVVGVDVSAPMISQARAANSAYSNCEFITNPAPNLQVLEGRTFNLILSLIVLQHVPPPYAERYLEAMLRLLAPSGAMVIQIPSHRTETVKNKIRSIIPERVFRLKHALLKSDVPYITMYGIRESRVLELARSNNARVVEVKSDRLAGDDWNSFTYFLQKNV